MRIAGRVVGFVVSVAIGHAILPHLSLLALVLITAVVAAIVYRPCN